MEPPFDSFTETGLQCSIFDRTITLYRIWSYAMTICKERFYQMWKRIDARGKASVVWQEIEQHYGQAHRAYHNLFHIHHCLNQLELVWQEVSDPYLISWALFFHDYFYDIPSNSNEWRSALASMRIAYYAQLPHEFRTASGILVFATKNHKIIETPHVAQKDIALLLDIDLVILGTPWEQYDQIFRRAIRKEYGSIPWEQYAEKRTKILEQFLERDKLYSHPFFHEHYGQQAGSNLKREIELLQTKNEEVCYAEN